MNNVTVGDIFPSSVDSARIKKEEKWYNFLVSHDSINYNLTVDQRTGKIVKNKVDPMVPIAATISDINADLLFGEFPVIKTSSDEKDKINEQWNDFKYDKSLHQSFLESASVTSAQGTVFCRFWKVESELYYDFVKVSRTIWNENYAGLENVKFIENIEPHKQNTEFWYEIQEHSIENGRHLLEHYHIIVDSSTNKVKDFNEIEPPIYTGYDFIPVVKALNQGRLGQLTGVSDYEGKEQLFSEIDNRIDQNNSILQDNADPWIGLPAGILDGNGHFNRRFGKMFERGISGNSGDSEVNIISYGAESIMPSLEHTKQMIEMCFFTSRISAPIAGLVSANGGAADSGRALKWKSVNTMSMINRKRTYWDSFIRSFVYMWGKLTLNEVEKKEIIIEWQDGLPMDDQEVIDNVIKQVQSKIMSREKGVQIAQVLNNEDAINEINKINEEETQRVNRETVNLTEAITI